MGNHRSFLPRCTHTPVRQYVWLIKPSFNFHYNLHSVQQPCVAALSNIPVSWFRRWLVYLIIKFFLVFLSQVTSYWVQSLDKQWMLCFLSWPFFPTFQVLAHLAHYARRFRMIHVATIPSSRCVNKGCLHWYICKCEQKFLYLNLPFKIHFLCR